MPTSYGKELLEDRCFARLYDLIYNAISPKLESSGYATGLNPAIVARFGSTDPDTWTMKFIFSNTRKSKGMTSLDYEEKSINPQIIKLLHSSGTDAEFESGIRGEIKHWFADLFDMTEFGLTRRVIEHDMEIAATVVDGTSFANVPETNLWHLQTCSPLQTRFSEQEIRSFAWPYRRLIDWPDDRQYDDYRKGKRSRRPFLDRKQMIACLSGILQKAEGSVAINVLTRAIINLHPYMVQDESDKYTYADTDVDLTNITYESVGMNDDDTDDYSIDEHGGESW
ncbi:MULTISPECIES: hypothetical protein [Bifidobacterium]|uniref:Uncharacterized protein n=1 Tax=Bifidobacterium reuteri DSM 23975 TaxID=1437610 RepID=A0A087CXC3_9BIFI|nr:MULTISPECIES: hypothetical protein [Bifidobacterium]KFI87923.1 hypothetical protein BREU_0700 [Bifidobacterium reuteri DSM 23975]TPF77650.1 hypothetical protein BW09_08620 [Bifidobacterium sp. UTCIF-1]TPF81796.1 hypothetical protein BW12_08095 [Bifidobacterium sp. UTCIF-3]TPF83685.1 hypothetical protein BW07_08680 [Bifidobacterium sp. UTCIF-36]TPF88670.1 hypothetical protein BW10_08540 [Bifidobacterium sp. UTBIF-56]